MVETNFPGLTSRFRFYQRLPVRAILAIDSGFLTERGRGILAWCEGRSDADEVMVCDASEVSFDAYADTVTTPNGTQPYLSANWPNIQDFVYGRRADGLEYDCDAAVLRRWVYGWIQDAFRAAKESLKEQTPSAPSPAADCFRDFETPRFRPSEIPPCRSTYAGSRRASIERANCARGLPASAALC